ncbi:hypothetical protein Tco_1398431, partial [Tanacetum coccineum]
RLERPLRVVWTLQKLNLRPLNSYYKIFTTRPPLSGLSSITIPEVTNGSSSQCSSSNGATSASETYDDNDVYVHRNDSLIVDDDDELVDSGQSQWVHGTLHVNEVIAVSVSIFRVVFIDCFDD